MERPVRSPGSTPLELFVELFKQKLYENEVASTLEVWQRISNIWRNIDVSVFENDRHGISDRMFLCQKVQVSSELNSTYFFKLLS